MTAEYKMMIASLLGSKTHDLNLEIIWVMDYLKGHKLEVFRGPGKKQRGLMV